MITLSSCFPPDRVERNAEFSTLGGLRSERDGVLAYADTIHYVRQLAAHPRIGAVLTTRNLAEKVGERQGVVWSDSPRDDFYLLHEKLFRQGWYGANAGGVGHGTRIHASAEVDPSAWIGEGVVVGAGAFVGPNVTIGGNVLIEPGARIGVEGILYRRTPEGIRRIPHGGGVRIGNGATILANATVVRSVHDSLLTEVGEGCIVGIASCIGHEAFLGADCVISGNCVLARNAVLGSKVFVGTNAYIRENVAVGDAAQIMAGSVVVQSVPAGGCVSGNFAIPHAARLKEFALKNLPQSGA